MRRNLPLIQIYIFNAFLSTHFVPGLFDLRAEEKAGIVRAGLSPFWKVFD